MKPMLIAVMALMIPLSAQADDPQLVCEKALTARNFKVAAQTAAGQTSFDGAMCAGRSLLAIGENDAAESSFTKAERVAASQFNRMVAITFQARAAYADGKADAALKHYSKSLALAAEIKALQGQWTSLNESGQILLDNKDYQGALVNFKQGYPFASNDNERSESNQLIAAAYHLSGDHDHAIEFQLKCSILEERSGDANQFLNAKLTLAQYQISGKEYQRAFNELNSIIKVAKEVGSTYWHARATLQLAHLEKLRGNTEQSTTLLQLATDLASQSGMTSLIEEVDRYTRVP